jgi:AcrR family transcriptional regulator
MARTKKRTPELRDHVLRVAVATLADEGVAGFTTRRVANVAATSTPAVYELFGDKAGLVREVFFEGFRLLDRYFERVDRSDDARTDVVAMIAAFRTFAGENTALAELMFSRPFADFDPEPSEIEAGAATREFIVDRVRRGIDDGALDGDATDIAQALFCLAQGLAAAETTGRLGTTAASRDRRWHLAVEALLRGLRPASAMMSG